jgi:hypothetical protein
MQIADCRLKPRAVTCGLVTVGVEICNLKSAICHLPAEIPLPSAGT